MKRRMCTRTVAPIAGLVAAVFAWQAWTPAAVALQEREMVAASNVREVGGRRVGEVVVNDDVALRIRFAAGGYSAPERADRVASRLNELRRDGRLRPEDLRSDTMNGQAVVKAGDELIITADWEHARANGTTPHRLAHQWRNNLAVAMGGTPVALGVRDGTRGRMARQPSRTSDRTAGAQAVQEEIRTKIVPILTLGSGGSIGVAQVSGPVSRVNDVKAVAQLSTDYKDAARLRIMVPVASENVVSNIRRVPQVSVTAVGALRF